MQEPELEDKINGFYTPCTSLETTPRPFSGAIDRFEYIVEIQSKDVPYKTLKNILYLLFPNISPEKAHQKREKIIKEYGLKNDDVIVYAKPAGAGLPRP